MKNNEMKDFFDENASSWNDGIIETEEEIENFLATYLPIKKKMQILDIGCGTGIITNALYNLSKEKVVGLDLSSKMLEIAIKNHDKRHVEYINCSFYDYNASNRYDMIVCYNAYPHFIDVINFKNKANELLLKNGYLAIIHNMSRKQLSKHHESLSHHLSRDLNTPEMEASVYLKDFNVINMIDNDNMFLLLLQKK